MFWLFTRDFGSQGLIKVITSKSTIQFVVQDTSLGCGFLSEELIRRLPFLGALHTPQLHYKNQPTTGRGDHKSANAQYRIDVHDE